jgi:hypothetical protein
LTPTETKFSDLVIDATLSEIHPIKPPAQEAEYKAAKHLQTSLVESPE